MNNLLHDQRFWAGLVGLIVIVVSSLHPDLEDNLNHIAPAVVGIIGTMIGINQAVSLSLPYQSTAVMTWHSKCKLTFTPKTDLVLFGVQYSMQMSSSQNTGRVYTFGLQKGNADFSLDTTDVVGSALASMTDLAVRHVIAGFNWIEYRVPVAVTRDTEVTIAPTLKGGIGDSSTASLRNPSVMILTALDVGAYE